MQRPRGSVWTMNIDPSHSLYLGRRDNTPVVLSHADRQRHLHVIGATGSGKSTLMEHMIAQDLAAGHGLALLDPHDNLAERVLGFVPMSRHGQILYFDPADDERPIGFNPIANISLNERARVAFDVTAAFKYIWPESWGARMDYILTHAIRSLMDLEHPTLIALPRLLHDHTWRHAQLDRLTDTANRRYWTEEYDAYTDRFRNEVIAPIDNKLGRLLMTPVLRNVLSQSTSRIDLKYMMDKSRVLIANLSTARLGREPAHLLGAMLLTGLTHAAFQRINRPPEARVPFYLYGDEIQTFNTESLDIILAEARKLGLFATSCHQFLAQLDRHPLSKLKASVFGNVGNFVSFRTGRDDAEKLARHIDLGTADQIRDLANFKAWAALLKSGQPSSPVQISVDPPMRSFNRPRQIANIKKNSRVRFGRDIKKVERHVDRMMGRPS